MNRPTMSLAAMTAACCLLAACGEREQVLQPPQQGGLSYQGKPDTRPWDHTPTAAGSSSWPAGDRGAWEKAIRARNQAQNESVRMP